MRRRRGGVPWWRRVIRSSKHGLGATGPWGRRVPRRAATMAGGPRWHVAYGSMTAAASRRKAGKLCSPWNSAWATPGRLSFGGGGRTLLVTAQGCSVPVRPFQQELLARRPRPWPRLKEEPLPTHGERPLRVLPSSDFRHLGRFAFERQDVVPSVGEPAPSPRRPKVVEELHLCAPPAWASLPCRAGALSFGRPRPSQPSALRPRRPAVIPSAPFRLDGPAILPGRRPASYPQPPRPTSGRRKPGAVGRPPLPPFDGGAAWGCSAAAAYSQPVALAGPARSSSGPSLSSAGDPPERPGNSAPSAKILSPRTRPPLWFFPRRGSQAARPPWERSRRPPRPLTLLYRGALLGLG